MASFLLPLPPGMPIEDAVLQVRVLHAGSEEGTGLLIGSAHLRLRHVLEDDNGRKRAYRWTLQLWEPSSRPQGTVDIELAVREMGYCVPPTANVVPPPPPSPGQEEGNEGKSQGSVSLSSDDSKATEDPYNVFSDEAPRTSEETSETSETSSEDKDEDGDTVMIDLAYEDDSEDCPSRRPE